ncbi:MAG: ABC transporter permease [Acidobacteriota bacterium]|nr:ABC transporter permease [Acidobacteriota bacterium]
MIWRRRMLKQLDDDIREHLERETQDNIDRGMSSEDARYAALRKFGNVSMVKEQTREVWSSIWLEQLMQDLRFGARTLRRSPGLTVAALLAISLGVGINVGIFSVLNGLAFRLLPVPHAGELVGIDQNLHFHGQGDRYVLNNYGYFSYSEYREYQKENHVFSGLVAYEPFIEATLAGRNAQQILGTAASCNYFDVLLEHPAEGRGFVNSDCTSPGANPVVVIGDALWRSRFGADPALIGKTITLNRTLFTVIGIARPGFIGTEPIASAFWVPVTMQKAIESGEDRIANDNMSWLAMLGRTRPGVTLDAVRADLGVIAGRIDRLHPRRTTTLSIHTARFFSSPEERKFLIPVTSVILSAFALVLLIACANVMNLLLARASVRQKEIAMRLSLGAGRWRLVRQLLTESLLLSFGGGVLGSLMAFLFFGRIIRFVLAHLPQDAPPLAFNVAPDFRVLGYALLLTVLTGIGFGLSPALQASRVDLNSSMKGDVIIAGSRKRGGRFLLNAMVGCQVALSMVLLIACGLLLRALYYAQTVDPGFDMNGVATMFLNLGKEGYDPARATQFMTQFRERLGSLPGVTGVAQAECAPLSRDFSVDRFTIPGRTSRVVPMEYNHVSANYFSLVGIPIVLGRGFSPKDTHDAVGIVVTESTARKLWPGEVPLGKIVRESSGREHVVIGVAKDAQVAHLGRYDTNYVYFPAGPQEDSRNYVMLRYTTNFGDVAKNIRHTIFAIDPNVRVEVTELSNYLEKWRAPSRLVAGLSGSLGGLALLLSSIGVYGMVSYSVSRSVRDIGIRLALGATKAEIMRHVLWQTQRPVLIGGAVGLLLASLVSGVLSGIMFGISAHDPTTFVAVPLCLFAIACAATLIPARRATQVDSMMALRCE